MMLHRTYLVALCVSWHIQAASGFRLPSHRRQQHFPLVASAPKRRQSSLLNSAITADTIDITASTQEQPLQFSDNPAARKRRLAASLAFLAGISDIFFSLQFQTFGSMLTGNAMWLSRALVQKQPTLILYYVTVFLSYMMGIAAVRLTRQKPPRWILRRVGITVAALFGTADALFYTMGLSRWLPVTMLAASFGMINSIGTDFAGTLTFVVTGHITKLTHLLSDFVVEKRQWTAIDVANAKQGVAVTFGFLGGAGLACWLHYVRNMLLRHGVLTSVGLAYAVLMNSYSGSRIKWFWKRRKAGEMMIMPVAADEVIREEILDAQELVESVIIPSITAPLPVTNATETDTVTTLTAYPKQGEEEETQQASLDDLQSRQQLAQELRNTFDRIDPELLYEYMEEKALAQQESMRTQNTTKDDLIEATNGNKTVS